MDVIYADLWVSMAEFKKNPASIVRTAHEKPVAVLSRNKTAFYILPPLLFEEILEVLEDRRWEKLVRKRLETKNNVVMMDTDTI